MKFDGVTYSDQVFELLPKYVTQTSKVRQTMQEASRCKYQKSIFGMPCGRNHGVHPPSEITDIVFASKGQYYFKPLKVTKSNPSLCTKFDAPQTASRIRGDPIGIARVVVARRTVSVDIAEIVRVTRINRAQPPIRRVF